MDRRQSFASAFFVRVFVTPWVDRISEAFRTAPTRGPLKSHKSGASPDCSGLDELS